VRKLLALIGIVVVALAVVVGAKTLLTPSRQLDIAAVTPVPVDAAAAAGRLGQAVRFKTISTFDDENANGAEFEALHAFLQASFPKAHGVLQRETIGKYALLYTWPGTDPKAQPYALMAHQDVVPIAPGTEADWQQPPFSGALRDGFVWGRGSWDDKGNLMSIMEAVELLASAGFQPRQTIHLIFGHDEEISGRRGAAQIAKLFKERGIHLQFVLDEGLLITDGLLAGLSRPAALIELAAHSSVPVINGLSELSHPCQGLTDYFTLREKVGPDLRGFHIAYVGDGNNTCHSLIFGAAKLGAKITIGAPAGYEPDAEVLRRARREARVTGAKIDVLHDPFEAVTGAQAVYTDVWASMGFEAETERRREIFSPFRVTKKLMTAAQRGAFFMHCLPAHRGDEVEAAVIDGRNSIVYDQAENRLHTQKAILLVLIQANQ